MIFTIIKTEYFGSGKLSTKPKTSRVYANNNEYGRNTVEHEKHKNYNPSPQPRTRRMSPHTAPKNSMNTLNISKFERTDSKEDLSILTKVYSDDRHRTIASNESHKVIPVQLLHDEEAIAFKHLASFDSPIKEHSQIQCS